MRIDFQIILTINWDHNYRRVLFLLNGYTRRAEDSTGATESRPNTDFDLGGRCTGNRVTGKTGSLDGVTLTKLPSGEFPAVHNANTWCPSSALVKLHYPVYSTNHTPSGSRQLS